MTSDRARQIIEQTRMVLKALRGAGWPVGMALEALKEGIEIIADLPDPDADWPLPSQFATAARLVADAGGELQTVLLWPKTNEGVSAEADARYWWPRGDLDPHGTLTGEGATPRLAMTALIARLREELGGGVKDEVAD